MSCNAAGSSGCNFKASVQTVQTLFAYLKREEVGRREKAGVRGTHAQHFSSEDSSRERPNKAATRT